MFRLEEVAAAVLSWIHCILLAAAIFVFAACLPVLDMSAALVYYRCSFWLLIPVAVSWFAVRKIKGFIPYLLVGTASAAVVLLGSRDLIAAALSVFVILMRSYPRLLRGKMLEETPGDVLEIEIWEIPTFLDCPKAIHWCLFLTVYFAVIISRRHELLKPLFSLLLAEIFVTYTYASIVRMKDFITNNRRIANLPVRTMQMMQRAVLCVTLFLLLLFVLPSILYGREPLTRLAYLEFDSGVVLESEPMQQAGGMEDGMQEMLEMIGEQETFELPEWIKQLLEGITYLTAVGGLLAVAVLIYQAFRRMMKNFAAGHGEDEIILLGTDETGFLPGRRRKRNTLTGRTPSIKIRREYRKLLKKKMSTRPLGWETPEELERTAGIPEQKRQIHELYEKARYASGECTKEELEHFIQEKGEI